MIETSTLDLLVGALACIVGVWFFVAWRRTGEPALLLFAVGLALKGFGYAAGGPDEFVSARGATLRDALRISLLCAGAVVMIAAYASGARGRRPWLYLGWGFVGLVVLGGAIDVLSPPVGDVDLRVLSASAHGLVALGNVGCAIFAFAGYRQSPNLARALVPTAFLVWGISNYTWLLIDLGAPSSFGAWVEGWRILAVLLMVAALVAPQRMEARDATA